MHKLENDVLEGLKVLAEPFVDTPNTVIRRLLVEKGILRPTGGVINNAIVQAKLKSEIPVRSRDMGIIERVMRPRARVGQVTPQAKYEEWLLKSPWQDFNGRAPKAEVTKAVITKMEKSGILKEIDYEPVSTGDSRAANTIAWARNALKEYGYIRKGSPWGIWELTEDGINKAKELLKDN